jgi:hypothetical protein
MFKRNLEIPKHKELVKLALISWREYVKDKPRIYNMDVCTAYQRGFISAYKRKLKAK